MIGFDGLDLDGLKMLTKAQLIAVPKADGRFDDIRIADNRLAVAGWLLCGDSSIESLEAYWNFDSCGPATRIRREDVAAVHPRKRHAVQSGFFVETVAEPWDEGRIDVVGFQGGRAVGRLSFYVETPMDKGRPLPSNEMTRRVSGELNDAYVEDGLKMFTDLMDQILLHSRTQVIRRVLDWGCGCGRLTRCLVNRSRFSEVHGCDIDLEAVSWCQDNLQNASFKHTLPSPPLPYQDGEFDLIIGCSVLTHISIEDQMKWLSELHRLLAPGGLLLVSVLGEWAFKQASWPISRQILQRTRSRIRTWVHERVLGRAPVSSHFERISEGRYRDAVFQSSISIKNEWSKIFHVVDHIDRGLKSYQDLVVLRRD